MALVVVPELVARTLVLDLNLGHVELVEHDARLQDAHDVVKPKADELSWFPSTESPFL